MYLFHRPSNKFSVKLYIEDLEVWECFLDTITINTYKDHGNYSVIIQNVKGLFFLFQEDKNSCLLYYLLIFLP